MRSFSPWERGQGGPAVRGASSHARGRGMRAPSEHDIAAGNVLLAVENVSLAFGGVKAVSGVSFDIRKGEIRAIIGPNGAGKTSPSQYRSRACSGTFSRLRIFSPQRRATAMK